MAESSSKSSCPFINKPAEEKPISKIPCHSGLGIFNTFRLLTKGIVPTLEEVCKNLDSTVFRMTLNDEHYNVCDHIAIKQCYEDEKFEKFKSFGYFVDNMVAQKNHLPTVHCTGTTHDTYKENFLHYLKFIQENTNENDVISDITNEFRNMKGWRNLTIEEGEEFDLEGTILESFARVFTKIAFGVIVEKSVLDEWLMRALMICYDVRVIQYWNDSKAADELYNAVRNTPYFQRLKEFLPNFSKDIKEEAIKDLTFSLCFNGYGGSRFLLLSTLICLFKISEEEKEAIKEECENFLKSDDRSFEKIEELKLLHQYYMEVARLYPPAPNIYRIAKNDIVLESTFNRYEVPKGKIVSGKSHMVHLDPLLYDNPKEFSLNRDIDVVNNNTYTWGGLYHKEPTARNYKCPGAKLGIAIHKIFIMHFLRCDMDVIGDLIYTGRSPLRVCASDEPVKMKTFQYME